MQNININKLKGIMVEKDVSVEKLAGLIGIDKATLYRKMQNEGRTMLVKDANAIVTALGMTSDQAMAVFFAQFVA